MFNIYRTWHKTTLWIPYLTLRKNRQNNGTVFEKKESYTISSWSKVVRKLSAKKFKDVICGQTSQIICTRICSIWKWNNRIFCTILVISYFYWSSIRFAYLISYVKHTLVFTSSVAQLLSLELESSQARSREQPSPQYNTTRF